MKKVWIAFIIMAAFTLHFSCQSDRQKGEQLAKTHCGSCHAFTPPELLDKTTWEISILPEMAFRMGLPSPVISQKALDDLQAVLPTIPNQPVVSKSDFQLIVKYFLEAAPDSLAKPKKIEPALLSQFEPVRVPVTENMPVVTMLTVDSAGRIFMGGRDNSLRVLQDHFSMAGKYSMDS